MLGKLETIVPARLAAKCPGTSSESQGHCLRPVPTTRSPRLLHKQDCVPLFRELLQVFGLLFATDPGRWTGGPSARGSGALGPGLPPAVEEVREFPDVLDGVLQRLDLGEWLAPLAVDRWQVIPEGVQGICQGPHPELLPLAGLPSPLHRHPDFGALLGFGTPSALQICRLES